MDRYEIVRQLGTGSFGGVFLAVMKKTRQKYAVKKLYGRYDWEEFVAFCELQSLVQTHCHPNIIRLSEVHLHQSTVHFVVEYMAGGNLHDAIQRRRHRNRISSNSKEQKQQQHCSLPDTWIRTMACHVLSAIGHMHKKGFAHRDIKPENLLVSHDDDDGGGGGGSIPVFKVADFSLARRIVENSNGGDHDLTPYVSTRWYRSPEQLRREKYGPPMDMFAIGCIVAEAYALEAIFQGESELDQLDLVNRHSPIDKRELRELITSIAPAAAVPEDGYDLMEKLLRYFPTNRCTAREALQHPFVRNVPVVPSAAVCPTTAAAVISASPSNGDQQKHQAQAKSNTSAAAAAAAAAGAGTISTTKSSTAARVYTPPPAYHSRKSRVYFSSATTTTTAFTTPAAPVTTIARVDGGSSTVAEAAARHNNNNFGPAPPLPHVVTTDQQRIATTKRTSCTMNADESEAAASSSSATGSGGGAMMAMATSTTTTTTTTTTRQAVISNPYSTKKKRTNDYVSPTY